MERHYYFQWNKLDFTQFEETEMRQMLAQPRAQKADLSVMFLETQGASLTSTKTQFLKKFGPSIRCMKIELKKLAPLACLIRIITILEMLPMLKLLGIVCRPGHAPGKRSNGSIENGIEREINHFVKNRRNLKQQLPQLETLQIFINGWGQTKIKETIATLLSHVNMTSFTMDRMPIPVECQFANITDLSLSVLCNDELETVLQISSPIKRLLLGIRGRVNVSLIFEVLLKFKASLCNFALRVSPGGYKLPMPIDLRTQLGPFMDAGILKECRHVKQASVLGCLPLSFNYLCGFKDNLERLHISLKRMEYWDDFLQEKIPTGDRIDEVLDILQYLKLVPTCSNHEMYESNIWRIFPRLQLLTVLFFEKAVDEERNETELKFTRQAYSQSRTGLM